MLLNQPWDRGNSRSRKPTWLAGNVIRALHGYGMKTSSRMKHSEHDGIHCPYQDISFDCGCEVQGDRGWRVCVHPLHGALASEPEGSLIAIHYFNLRRTFDEVLREAWARLSNVRSDMDMRGSGFSPVRYREEHDLCDRPIWDATGLQVELANVPGIATLSLYNTGIVARPTLALELTLADE